MESVLLVHIVERLRVKIGEDSEGKNGTEFGIWENRTGQGKQNLVLRLADLQLPKQCAISPRIRLNFD